MLAEAAGFGDVAGVFDHRNRVEVCARAVDDGEEDVVEWVDECGFLDLLGVVCFRWGSETGGSLLGRTQSSQCRPTQKRVAAKTPAR